MASVTHADEFLRTVDDDLLEAAPGLRRLTRRVMTSGFRDLQLVPSRRIISMQMAELQFATARKLETAPASSSPRRECEHCRALLDRDAH
jgi:hypothetical protein